MSARRRRGDTSSPTLARRFAECLRVGDPVGANAAIDSALADGLEPPAVQTRVVASALHSIGWLWEDGVLSAPEAHLATAVASQALAHLYSRVLAPAAQREERILVAAVQGEYHLLGPRMAADTLEAAGYDVRLAGCDLRPPVLSAELEEHRPAAVALGLTMPLGNRSLVAAMIQIREFDPSIRLLVGGQGVAPLVWGSPGVVYVPDTELLVATLQAALSRPVKAELPTRLAGGGVVFPEPPPGFGETVSIRRGVDSLEARMAHAAAAGAETTREQARRAFRLEQLASRDPLTDLWNRRAFDDQFVELLRQGSAENAALLLIDVDHFKDVNDRLGKSAGDSALVKVARCIAGALRPQDFAARYGADEFAVLLGATSAQEALSIAERIRGQVQQDVDDPQVSVSIGVSTAQASSRREAKASVDRALEEARSSGYNRVAIARPGGAL